MPPCRHVILSFSSSVEDTLHLRLRRTLRLFLGVVCRLRTLLGLLLGLVCAHAGHLLRFGGGFLCSGK